MSVFSSFDFDNVKGILIDLDNTLYEYAPCHEAGLLAVYAMLHEKHTMTYDEYLLRYKDAQRKVKTTTEGQAASHSRFLYFQKMLEDLEGRTNVEATIAYEEQYWRSFEKRVVLRQEAVDFLLLCKKKGLPTCLLTDLTASVQFRKMVATGVDKLVDYIVTSEEAGKEKPDSAIFSLALSKVGLSAGDVVMIGDDRLKDIDGAQTLGIKAYLV
jgi:putative hydrolase of the HAD superfamily